ncbi:uncharacterized protein LOC144770294 isoform X2 [Lissotriton helveticus]
MTCKRKRSSIRLKGAACQRKSSLERALSRRSRTRTSLAKRRLIKASIRRHGLRWWSLGADNSDGFREPSSSECTCECTMVDDISWWTDNRDRSMLTDRRDCSPRSDNIDSTERPEIVRSNSGERSMGHDRRDVCVAAYSEHSKGPDKNGCSTRHGCHPSVSRPSSSIIANRSEISPIICSGGTKRPDNSVDYFLSDENDSIEMSGNSDFSYRGPRRTLDDTAGGERSDKTDSSGSPGNIGCGWKPENNGAGEWSECSESSPSPGRSERSTRPDSSEYLNGTEHSEHCEKADGSEGTARHRHDYSRGKTDNKDTVGSLNSSDHKECADTNDSSGQCDNSSSMEGAKKSGSSRRADTKDHNQRPGTADCSESGGSKARCQRPSTADCIERPDCNDLCRRPENTVFARCHDDSYPSRNHNNDSSGSTDDSDSSDKQDKNGASGRPNDRACIPVQNKNDSSGRLDNDDSSEEQTINDGRPNNSYPSDKEDKNDSSSRLNDRGSTEKQGKNSSSSRPDNNGYSEEHIDDFHVRPNNSYSSEKEDKNDSTCRPDHINSGRKKDRSNSINMLDNSDSNEKQDKNGCSLVCDKCDSFKKWDTIDASSGKSDFIVSSSKSDNSDDLRAKPENNDSSRSPYSTEHTESGKSSYSGRDMIIDPVRTNGNDGSTIGSGSRSAGCASATTPTGLLCPVFTNENDGTRMRNVPPLLKHGLFDISWRPTYKNPGPWSYKSFFGGWADNTGVRMPDGSTKKWDKKASTLGTNTNDCSKSPHKNFFDNIPDKAMSSQRPDHTNFAGKVDHLDSERMDDKKESSLRDKTDKSSIWSVKNSNGGPGNHGINFGGSKFTRRPYTNDMDKRLVDSDSSKKQDISSTKRPANMGSSGTSNQVPSKNRSSQGTGSTNPRARPDFVAKFEKDDCSIWAFNDFKWMVYNKGLNEWPAQSTRPKPDNSGSWRFANGRMFYCPHKCDLCDMLDTANTTPSKDSGDFLKLRPDDSWRRPEGVDFLWDSSDCTGRAEGRDFIRSPDCSTLSGNFLRLRQDDSWRRPEGYDFLSDTSACTGRAEGRGFIKRAGCNSKGDCNISRGRLHNRHRKVLSERNLRSGSGDSGTKPDNRGCMWRSNKSHPLGRPENSQLYGRRINTNEDICKHGGQGASVRPNNSGCRWKSRSDAGGMRSDSVHSGKLGNGVCLCTPDKHILTERLRSGGYSIHFNTRRPFTKSQATSFTPRTFNGAILVTNTRMQKKCMKTPQKSAWIRDPYVRVRIFRTPSRTRGSRPWLSSFRKRPHQGTALYRAPLLHQLQQEAATPAPWSRHYAQQADHQSIPTQRPAGQDSSHLLELNLNPSKVPTTMLLTPQAESAYSRKRI